MENKKQKKKIQIGIIIHFQRDNKGRIIVENTVNEPIYTDWTPELQRGQDEMFKNFAKFVADKIIECQRNGVDLSKLGTFNEDKSMKNFYKK